MDGRMIIDFDSDSEAGPSREPGAAAAKPRSTRAASAAATAPPPAAAPPPKQTAEDIRSNLATLRQAMDKLTAPSPSTRARAVNSEMERLRREIAQKEAQKGLQQAGKKAPPIAAAAPAAPVQQKAAKRQAPPAAGAKQARPATGALAKPGATAKQALPSAAARAPPAAAKPAALATKTPTAAAKPAALATKTPTTAATATAKAPATAATAKAPSTAKAPAPAATAKAPSTAKAPATAATAGNRQATPGRPTQPAVQSPTQLRRQATPGSAPGQRRTPGSSAPRGSTPRAPRFAPNAVPVREQQQGGRGMRVQQDDYRRYLKQQETIEQQRPAERQQYFRTTANQEAVEMAARGQQFQNPPMLQFPPPLQRQLHPEQLLPAPAAARTAAVDSDGDAEMSEMSEGEIPPPARGPGSADPTFASPHQAATAFMASLHSAPPSAFPAAHRVAPQAVFPVAPLAVHRVAPQAPAAPPPPGGQPQRPPAPPAAAAERARAPALSDYTDISSGAEDGDAAGAGALALAARPPQLALLAGAAHDHPDTLQAEVRRSLVRCDALRLLLSDAERTHRALCERQARALSLPPPQLSQGGGGGRPALLGAGPASEAGAAAAAAQRVLQLQGRASEASARIARRLAQLGAQPAALVLPAPPAPAAAPAAVPPAAQAAAPAAVPPAAQAAAPAAVPPAAQAAAPATQPSAAAPAQQQRQQAAPMPPQEQRPAPQAQPRAAAASSAAVGRGRVPSPPAVRGARRESGSSPQRRRPSPQRRSLSTQRRGPSPQRRSLSTQRRQRRVHGMPASSSTSGSTSASPPSSRGRAGVSGAPRSGAAPRSGPSTARPRRERSRSPSEPDVAGPTQVPFRCRCAVLDGVRAAQRLGKLPATLDELQRIVDSAAGRSSWERGLGMTFKSACLWLGQQGFLRLIGGRTTPLCVAGLQRTDVGDKRGRSETRSRSRSASRGRGGRRALSPAAKRQRGGTPPGQRRAPSRRPSPPRKRERSSSPAAGPRLRLSTATTGPAERERPAARTAAADAPQRPSGPAAAAAAVAASSVRFPEARRKFSEAPPPALEQPQQQQPSQQPQRRQQQPRQQSPAGAEAPWLASAPADAAQPAAHTYSPVIHPPEGSAQQGLLPGELMVVRLAAQCRAERQAQQLAQQFAQQRAQQQQAQQASLGGGALARLSASPAAAAAAAAAAAPLVPVGTPGAAAFGPFGPRPEALALAQGGGAPALVPARGGAPQQAPTTGCTPPGQVAPYRPFVDIDLGKASAALPSQPVLPASPTARPAQQPKPTAAAQPKAAAAPQVKAPAALQVKLPAAAQPKAAAAPQVKAPAAQPKAAAEPQVKAPVAAQPKTPALAKAQAPPAAEPTAPAPAPRAQRPAGRIDPDWPFCPFELRGACRDAKCSFQMARDTMLPRPRLPEAALRACALDSAAPAYNLPGALRLAGGGPATGDRGGAALAALAARTAGRPLLSTLLAPAASPYVAPWHLVPGAHAVSGPPELALADWQRAQVMGQAQRAAAHGLTAAASRYFAGGDVSAAATAATAAATTAATQQRREREGPVAGGDVACAEAALALSVPSLWCLGRGALDATSQTALMLSLKRGLEAHRHSYLLWPLFLHIYLGQPASDGGAGPDAGGRERLIEDALRFCPPCHRFWLVVVGAAKHWRDAAAALQRGVLALASPDPPPGEAAATGAAAAAPGGAAAAAPICAARAAAALDLALRLLGLLGGVATPESAELLAVWVSPAEQGAGPAGAARRALLDALRGHPGALCVLWTSAAHVAAYGRLPQAVQHSLGYPQPLAALRWPAGELAEPRRAAAAAALHEAVRCLGDAAAATEPQLQGQPEPGAGERLPARASLELSKLRFALALASSQLDQASRGRPRQGVTNALRDAAGAVELLWRRAASTSRGAGAPPVVPPPEVLQLLGETAAQAAAAETAGETGARLWALCAAGRLHPAAAAALAAAAAAAGGGGAARKARLWLWSWAERYAQAPTQAWPDVPLSTLEMPAAPAAPPADEPPPWCDEAGACERFDSLLSRLPPGDAARSAFAAICSGGFALLGGHAKHAAARFEAACELAAALPGLHGEVLVSWLRWAALVQQPAGSAAPGAAAWSGALAAAARVAPRVPALAWPSLPSGLPPLAAAALLPPPAARAGSAAAGALRALLPALPPALRTRVVESALSSRPADPETAALAVSAAQLAAADAAARGVPAWRDLALSWALPCAAGALLGANPPAAPELWLQAVELAHSVSPPAGAELASAAVRAHPYSAALAAQRLPWLAGGAAAAERALAAERGLAPPPA